MKSGSLLHRIKIGTQPKEFFVGASGVVLVLFVLAHLAGNFLLFLGPDAFNEYARRLHSVGALLWVARIGLLAAFLIHVSFTIWLTVENRAARNSRYIVPMKATETTFSRTTMIYTGLLLFAFLLVHIYDFALSNQMGSHSIVNSSGSDKDLGLYGIVWNSFANPWRSMFYIAAICAVGLHLTSAITTIWMTFGILPEKTLAKMGHTAQIVGTLVAGAFISIPLYVLATTYLTYAPY